MSLDSYDASTKFRLNNSLETISFDSSGEDETLYELTDTQGNFRQFTVKSKLHSLLMKFKNPLSLEVFFEEISSEVTSEEKVALRSLLNNYFIPKGVLVHEHSENKPPTRKKNRKPAYMLAKFRIFSPSIVNFLSKPLVLLFNYPLLIITLLLFIASQVIFFRESLAISSEINITSHDILISLSIIFTGLVFHEFGHASAAVRRGCKDVDIGVGLYICFIVFYADLSEIWRLKRRDRVIIDAAGLYFQMIFMVPLALLFLFSSYLPLYLANVALALSFLWNLNPFFRLDGYWIASDLLGLDNLRAASHSQLSGESSPKLVSTYRFNKGNNRALMIYAWLSRFTFIALVIWFSFFVLKDVLMGLPNILHQFDGELSSADMTVAIIGIVWTMLMLFFAAHLFLAVIRPIKRMITNQKLFKLKGF